MKTDEELFDSALIAGLALYGPPRDYSTGGFGDSGLIWHTGGYTVNVRHVNLSQIPAVVDDWEDMGDFGECVDNYPYTDDFEYQFHPSSNTGIDCACEPIKDLIPDVDGNIYLYWPETGIRVIHTKNDWVEV